MNYEKDDHMKTVYFILVLVLWNKLKRKQSELQNHKLFYLYTSEN